MERNKAVVMRLQDALGAKDVDAAVACIAEDATNFGMKVGRAGFRAVLGSIFTTFPHNKSHVEKLFAEDDWVVVHVRITGIHLGRPTIPHDGDLRHVEPTGKIFDYYAVHFWRIRDGLVIEHEAVRDDLRLHRQLGLVPTPA